MIPTRSRDSRTRSVNSGRAVTHVVEPRRVVIKGRPQIAKKYRDATARGSDAGSPAQEEAHQWQWESATHNAGVAVALVPRPSPSDADKSLHASGVKGPTLRARRSMPWWPVVRRPIAHALSAHMSTTGL